jgi:hypothetical protein
MAKGAELDAWGQQVLLLPFRMMAALSQSHSFCLQFSFIVDSLIQK